MKSNPQGSFDRLAAALNEEAATPIVLRGGIGSGRSSIVREVARQLDLEVVEYEAAMLARSPVAAPGSGGGGTYSTGMQTPLDDLRAMAVIRDGDPVVLVVDHVDLPLLGDVSALVEAMEWMAVRLRVVAIAEPGSRFTTPPGWRDVEHTVPDVQHFWSQGQRSRPERDGL